MKGVRPVRVWQVILALAAFGTMARPPMLHPMQLPEAPAASGGSVAQSENCAAGREQDGSCLPRVPGGPTVPSEPIPPPFFPPVPPEPPPLMPPAPPGLPLVVPLRPPVLSAGLPPHPHFPKVIGGTAKAKLHTHDADQDVTYDSDVVGLIFIQRPVQDMPGTTQYVLTPPFQPLVSGDAGPMRTTWTVQGRRFDCTIDGKATVIFTFHPDPRHPGFATIPGWNDDLDVTLPAFGYLHLAGPDGGDYHHIMVKMTDPEARVTKTCPGPPPMITQEGLEVGYLLHVIWEKNRYDTTVNGSRIVILKGQLSFDQDDPLDALNLLPEGEARDIAREGYNGQGFGALSSTGTSHRYTWEWDLYGLMPDENQPPAP